MLTVRLDEQTERRLEALMRQTGRSRSEIVREAIRSYEPELPEDAGRTVYDRLADVIGVGQIGGQRGRNSERILREAFVRKKRSR